MGTVDTLIGNNLLIDFEIYVYWINGYSIDECKGQIMKRDADLNETYDKDIIHNDILDHYLIFNKLEQYLHSPTRLKEQMVFQVTDEMADKLIEKYYEYNTNVMRELLGYKLSQRQRKDLDDISEKTSIRVRSCRRQFDNLKRICRTIEDMKGGLVKVIKENFLLPAKMTEQYALFVFIATNHFEISKKKLSYLSLEDFMYCANQMIKYWSSGELSTDCDLNKDFLIDLKDLKIFVDRDYVDDHRRAVLTSIQTKSTQLYRLVEPSFKDLSKSIIDIAYALNHSKDMRDLFLDIYERIIETCKDNDWTKADVKMFLEEYHNCARRLEDIHKENPDLLAVFDRYFQTLANCILQMYR